MISLFDQITQDESTLAANMVLHAHKSVEAWAARYGLSPCFSDKDFHNDMERLEKALKGNSKPKAIMYVTKET